MKPQPRQVPPDLATILRRVDAIHAVVVDGAPASDDLIRTAQSVVEARYYQGHNYIDQLHRMIDRLEALVGRGV